MAAVLGYLLPSELIGDVVSNIVVFGSIRLDMQPSSTLSKAVTKHPSGACATVKMLQLPQILHMENSTCVPITLP
jgi:hypothetical protein